MGYWYNHVLRSNWRFSIFYLYFLPHLPPAVPSLRIIFIVSGVKIGSETMRNVKFKFVSSYRCRDAHGSRNVASTLLRLSSDQSPKPAQPSLTSTERNCTASAVDDTRYVSINLRGPRFFRRCRCFSVPTPHRGPPSFRL